MNKPLIKFIKVNKSFDEQEVLKELDLTIQKGAVHGIVGPNGSGKTTILNVLAGVFPVDGGAITYDDQLVYENYLVKLTIVYLTDQHCFFGCKNLIELAKFYASIYPTFNWEHYKNLVKVFEFDEKKSIQKLSKGMKKQAAFIVCIASKPEVLLLDELVDGIDPIKRQLLWSVLMKEVADRDLTVVIASHNIRELEGVCSDLSIIVNGTCILEDNIENMREQHGQSMEDTIITMLGGVSNETKDLILK